MQHYCWWNKYVANPIKKDGYQGPGRLAMRVLKEEILPAILLRRTKVQCADVLALPPRYTPLSLRTASVPYRPQHSVVSCDLGHPSSPLFVTHDFSQPHDIFLAVLLLIMHCGPHMSLGGAA